MRIYIFIIILLLYFFKIIIIYYQFLSFSNRTWVSAVHHPHTSYQTQRMYCADASKYLLVVPSLGDSITECSVVSWMRGIVLYGFMSHMHITHTYVHIHAHTHTYTRHTHAYPDHYNHMISLLSNPMQNTFFNWLFWFLGLNNACACGTLLMLKQTFLIYLSSLSLSLSNYRSLSLSLARALSLSIPLSLSLSITVCVFLSVSISVPLINAKKNKLCNE